MLSVEQQSEILSLYFGKGMAIRRIARELKIDRKAVRRTVERRSVRMSPLPSTGRLSILDPFKETISELLMRDPSISASTILHRIRAKGYLGGKTVLGDYVSLLRQHPYRSREAFLKIDFEKGECAQVDWGEFGDVFGDGIKIHCFVIVLCYSRYLYIEFTRGEKFEDFIRCHQNAFNFFEGLVPRECWYDNLRTAVSERLNSLVKFNSRFLAYMGHHGIRPHACNPARGNEKGRVEDGVKYIRSSFWAGAKFANFEDLCAQAKNWIDTVANRREHRATRKIPFLFFSQEEKSALMPMNPHPYDTDEVFSKTVPPNFMILYETNRYSVPWTLVGMPVTVRVDDRSIRIYYHEQLVAGHERSYKKHQQFCKEAHVKGLYERKPGASQVEQKLSQIRYIGTSAEKYLDFIKSGDRSLKSEATRMLAFATVYGEKSVDDACKELLDRGIVGTANLELLLKTSTSPENKNPDPLIFQKEKLNRSVAFVDLRRYDRLLFESGDSDSDSTTQGDICESGIETVFKK